MLALPDFVKGEEIPTKTGTLIVRYQTGLHGERLDRIRFLLTNRELQQQLYPKTDGYVEDLDHLTRMVIIAGIPSGEYQLEFVIPNADGCFEPVAPRWLQIEGGQVVKIDQVIQICYSTLRVKAQLDRSLVSPSPSPMITLWQNNRIYAQTASTEMNFSQLFPGQYTIQFGFVPGYQTPPQTDIFLKPGENIGPIVGLYRPLSSLY
jgi:hypothetical protein